MANHWEASGCCESQSINGEEHPPYLYDSDGNKKPEFDRVSWVHTRLTPPAPDQQATFFALGSDTGNLQ